jgi:hypothetical protein
MDAETQPKNDANKKRPHLRERAATPMASGAIK